MKHRSARVDTVIHKLTTTPISQIEWMMIAALAVIGRRRFGRGYVFIQRLVSLHRDQRLSLKQRRWLWALGWKFRGRMQPQVRDELFERRKLWRAEQSAKIATPS